jgi:hypothetical protein
MPQVYTIESANGNNRSVHSRHGLAAGKIMYLHAAKLGETQMLQHLPTHAG